MHLHVDALGGVAGDMFAAALLHAAPEAAADVGRCVQIATETICELVPHTDGVLAGMRFTIGVQHRSGHGHTQWSKIRRRLADSALDEPTRRHAIGIFQLLAEAEARVHGVDADEIVFHEVGAVDSIADIVAASSLIAQLDINSFSVSPLPIGRGRVDTAHGLMPVPAPAVAILLEGFETIDDGIAGERVTPTGAAILKYLGPGERPAGVGRLAASGYGFGTRELPGISNCLRALLFASADAGRPAAAHRTLAVIAFEVDDQSGEDLAAGIARIRAHDGVHDVIQIPGIGKKGRFAVQLQVLADERACEGVIEQCFRETTTIGLRIQHVEARALVRRTDVVRAAGRDVRVKLVERPGGETGKPEADDLAGDAAARAALRAEALLAARGSR